MKGGVGQIAVHRAGDILSRQIEIICISHSIFQIKFLGFYPLCRKRCNMCRYAFSRGINPVIISQPCKVACAVAVGMGKSIACGSGKASVALNGNFYFFLAAEGGSVKVKGNGSKSVFSKCVCVFDFKNRSVRTTLVAYKIIDYIAWRAAMISTP